MSLFRLEVGKRRQIRHYGEVLIARPLGVTVLTCVASAVVLAVVVFFVWGSYTKKRLVHGVLVPDKGLIKVYPPRSGTAVSLEVREGDYVQKGQLLYVLSNDVINTEGQSAQTAIREGLLSQKQSLVEEAQRQERLNGETKEITRDRLNGMQRELRQIERVAALLEQQVQLSQRSAEEYEASAKDGVVSKAEAQAKRLKLLDIQTEAVELARQRTVLERDIQAAVRELQAAALRGKNQVAVLDRTRSDVERDLLQTDVDQEIRVVAPTSGTVTGIRIKPGQVSDRGPLLSLLPEGATLEAELYAPSAAISFIKPDRPVLLRYRAFPYQKFGHQRGSVRYVSRAPVEIDGSAQAPGQVADQIYRITVALPKQSMAAYGKDEVLQAGMEVDADILLDRRHLYEWLLEPLYSISGRW